MSLSGLGPLRLWNCTSVLDLTGLAAQIFSKGDSPSLCLIWKGSHSSSGQLPYIPKSHKKKKCHILPRDNIWSERQPLQERTWKSCYLCLVGKGGLGCHDLGGLGLRRCGGHDKSKVRDHISQGTQSTIPEVGGWHPSAEPVTPGNFNRSVMKTRLAPPISKAPAPIHFALMVCKMGLKCDL